MMEIYKLIYQEKFKIIEKFSINVIYIILTKFQMKYPIGVLILLFSIYSVTDLAIKTRYTRKRLTSEKHQKKLNSQFRYL